MFNFSALNAALGRLTHDFAPEIEKEVRVGLELETEIPMYAAVGDYTFSNISTTEVLQKRTTGWSQKGDNQIGGETVSQKQIKVNIQFDANDMERLRTEFGQKMNWIDPWGNIRPTDWSLPEYLLSNAIVPKVREELNMLSGSGVFNAGSAASINTVDGVLTVVTQKIAAGTLVPVVTNAAFTPANIIAEIDKFAAAIKEEEKAKGGIIRCSWATYRMWRSAYIDAGQTNFLVAMEMGLNDQSRLPKFQNIVLKPYFSWGTSSRLMFKQADFEPIGATYNPIYGLYPTGIWDYKPLDQVLGFALHFDRGYGLKFLKRTFVNNLA